LNPKGSPGVFSAAYKEIRSKEMLAKILIPVRGPVLESDKTADKSNQNARPSFLLIPAVPLPDASGRAVRQHS
jgi:hypothetical protein